MRKRMTENQRSVWVLSMPVCASINDTIHTFSVYEASDQHKDKSAARQAIDLIDYLNERDRFIENDPLCLTLPMVWQLNKSYYNPLDRLPVHHV